MRKAKEMVERMGRTGGQQGISSTKCPNCKAIIVFPSNSSYYLPAANQHTGYASNYHPTGYDKGYYPEQPQPLPRLSPIPTHLKKRALLIGISYKGTQNVVKGSVNDVRRMTHFLDHWLGFRNESLLVLTEEESNPDLVPTKQNIRKAFGWLLQGCQSGDSLVFFYFGHGSQVLDLDRDEEDGLDELLCPVDYRMEGKITDDEINTTVVRPLPKGAKLHAIIDTTVVRPLPKGAKLHAIIDTCRSGTFLDLPYMCKMDNRQGDYVWEDQGIPTLTPFKGTSGGTAICISACDDDETSLDSTAFTGGDVTGALTYSFIEAAKERGLTYGLLLFSIHTKISETQKR